MKIKLTSSPCSLPQRNLKRRPISFSATVVWTPINLRGTNTFGNNTVKYYFDATNDDDDSGWAYRRIRDIYVLGFVTFPSHMSTRKHKMQLPTISSAEDTCNL